MRLLLLMALLFAGSGTPAAAAAAGQDPDSVLSEARQLFEALDYEQAVPALDRAIATLEASADEPGPGRAALARAFEMRGRARFGLGDLDGARGDFQALLAIEPSFAFDAQVSPRVVALLNEVRNATIGNLQLVVEPSDAAVTVNGRPVVASSDPLALPAGDVTVKVERVGFRPFEGQVAVVAGSTAPLQVTLERTASVVFLVTAPPGVEVVVDGVSRGVTDSPVPLQEGGVSKPLVLTELAPGTHVAMFRGDCLVQEERQMVLERLDDYRMEPVRLRRAVATVSVRSTPEGATVLLDGEARGATPIDLTDVCEGERLLTLRGPHGRFSEAVRVTAGQTVSVQGVLKPAFALLPGSEPPTAGLTDPRVTVKRALASGEPVTLFVPPVADLEAATEGQPLPPDWLSFDTSRRPVGGASALGTAARRELSARLSKGLSSEGVATVVQPTPSSPDMVLTLLAAGAAEPDVLAVTPERADSVAEAVERLNHVPEHVRRGFGAVLLETNRAGSPLVVAAVEPGGPAERAGLRPGEGILEVDGQAVTSAVELERTLALRRGGEEIPLVLSSRGGERRSVMVPLVTTPTLISADDQTLLFNALAVVFRSRLDGAQPEEAPFIRLNLAVALLRAGDFAGAREQLTTEPLPAGEGVSRGTQLYLLGLAYEGLGDTSAAAEAFRDAVEAGGRLTEDGPGIGAVVQAKLGR